MVRIRRDYSGKWRQLLRTKQYPIREQSALSWSQHTVRLRILFGQTTYCPRRDSQIPTTSNLKQRETIARKQRSLNLTFQGSTSWCLVGGSFVRSLVVV